jgi:uncharacterized protein (DUF488 family)
MRIAEKSILNRSKISHRNSSTRKAVAVHEPDVYTIGHSTRTIEDFLSILKTYGIKEVVDIRTIPRSRHNPQFNKDILPGSLKSSNIKYVHMAGLGGLRHALPDSVNKAWRNASFRGYADYMQTREFESALEKLIGLSRRRKIVLMCGEAVPWRCHRSLVADALVIRKIQTTDIFSLTVSRRHILTPWAKVRGKHITYPMTASETKTNS